MNKYQSFQRIINLIIVLLIEVQSLTEQEINDIVEGEHPKCAKIKKGKLFARISRE